ncbi:unnamed protein product, partial [Hapterophycus canaliculatus]
MAVVAMSNLFRGTGSTLGRRRSSRFDQHNSRSGGNPCNSCGGREAWTAIMVLLVCAIITWPYVVFGPSVVFSVNISRREEYGTDTRRSSVRGLSGYPATNSIDGTPLVVRSNQATKSSGGYAEPGPRDLCLGMAVGVSSAQLVTFAASFREVAPQADLVLFFEAPTSDRFKDIIEKLGILSLEIDRGKLEPAALRRYHPSSARWIMIQRFLDTKGSDYERVLIADAGQVFFQGSPFDIIGDPGIYAFTDDKTIGEYEERSAKIRDCLGESVLAKLTDKPALYSAVSLGTSSSAADYARQMSNGLLSPSFQACESAGVDAGLQEYLVYGGGMPGVLRFDQATGPVADVQAGKFKMSNSRVTNPTGREVPIVYRYVANASMKESVFERYMYWTPEEGV